MRKFIKDYLAKEYDNYVKDLEALTNIDSGNGDLEGTEAANKFVAAKMQALGAETEFRYNDRGCHLISRLKGKGTQTVLWLRMLIPCLNAAKLPNAPSAWMKTALPGARA